MAKKKKSTKIKKRVSINDLSERELKARLHQKIHIVMSKHRVFDCAEEHNMGKGEDAYFSTRASDVFKTYGDTLLDVGLTFIPIQGGLAPLGRYYAVRASIEYQITDIETGYSETVWGGGDGNNGVWSANSAQTVARKQAMLNTFNASYPQPENAREIRVREIRAELPEIDLDKMAKTISKPLINDMKEFFGNYTMKGKKNG